MYKIIVRMRGGLGNQLFILAFAYKLAFDLGSEDYEIVLDIREYETYKTRNFEILDLIQDDRIRIYDSEIDYSWKYEFTRKLYHVMQKIIPNYRCMSKMLSRFGLYYTKRNAKGYDKGFANKELYVYGYFQDAEMTFSVREKMFSHFRLPEITGFEFKRDVNYIAVSIRCGADYVNAGWPICTEAYFCDGINEIVEEKYLDKKVVVLVFADDINTAKKMISKENVLFVENMSAIEQIALMSKCDDFVMSNSSFSWWGAFVGVKRDSIVIAPDRWYYTKEPTSSTLLNYSNVRIRKN